MLDIKFIRENAALVKANSENRLAKVDIDRLVALDKERRKIETEIDSLRGERNTASKIKPTPAVMEQMKKVGEEIKVLEAELAQIEPQYRELLLEVPNLTHPSVVVSQDEDDNPIVESYGKPTKFDFTPKDHVELATALDLIDFDRAAKVTGAKFYYLKNELALLEFALIQYALEILIKHDFAPFITPDLAKREILEGLGYKPRGEATQIYNVKDSELSLIGTAEITMGGYHQSEVLLESELPKKYVAVSHCFRTEAGSYTKYSKGIFRVHQFTKIEMFVYSLPQDSETAHMELLDIEREIFSGLEVPFRVVDHCTADLGAPSYHTFDLEAWMPGKPNKEDKMGDWAEITSTSNCTDYQARGLNIKYKDAGGEKHYVHMLNGTAIAITRALIAIMENFQQADGSIAIPKALQKYLPGNLQVITKKK
jgi:seryl-tRNA synthetase